MRCAGVTLLPAHRADVQRVGRLLILGLLELGAIDELNVGNGYSSGLPGVLVLEAAPESGENIGEVIIERGRGAPVLLRRSGG